MFSVAASLAVAVRCSARGRSSHQAAVTAILDRPGDPADIVAAAVEHDPPERPWNPGPYQGRRCDRSNPLLCNLQASC
jgi:hypothetical protein